MTLALKKYDIFSYFEHAPSSSNEKLKVTSCFLAQNAKYDICFSLFLFVCEINSNFLKKKRTGRHLDGFLLFDQYSDGKKCKGFMPRAALSCEIFLVRVSIIRKGTTTSFVLSHGTHQVPSYYIV
jgi:hypothetical protein